MYWSSDASTFLFTKYFICTLCLINSHAYIFVTCMIIILLTLWQLREYTSTANKIALLCFDRLSRGGWEFPSLLTGHWPGGPAPLPSAIRGQRGQPGGQSGVCGGGGTKVRPRDCQKVLNRVWYWLKRVLYYMYYHLMLFDNGNFPFVLIKMLEINLSTCIKATVPHLNFNYHTNFVLNS